MKSIKIEKRKAFEHVVGNEYAEELAERHGFNEISEILSEYISFAEKDHEDSDKLENLEIGEYSIDCGDFYYIINIE